MELMGGSGGTISLQAETELRQAFSETLLRLSEAIDGFERLLRESPNEVEEVFHQYLRDNPILIDVYATHIESKPRFRYPEPQPETSKSYGEPDFVVGYSDPRYRLIEL